MAAKTARAPKAKSTSNGDGTSLHVSLPQMLDLALGTPEVGAVNLNILHNFLHVLLHQVNLRSTKVEYRGEDANRVKAMVTATKAGPTLHLHEYSITDGSGKQRHRIQSTDNLSVNVEVITGDSTDAKVKEKTSPKRHSKSSASAPASARGDLTRDAGKSAHTLVHSEPETKKSKAVKQEIRPGHVGESQTVFYVEPIVDGAVPTALGFKQLNESVKHLEERFQALDELTTNPELVERLKGKITDPLTDVWQVINITKRLDAAEQGIDKLTTVLQDAIKGDAGLGDTSSLNERLVHLEKTVAVVEEMISASSSAGGVSVGVGAGDEQGDETIKEGEDAEGRPDRDKSAGQTSGRFGSDSADMQGIVTALKTEMAQVRKDIHDLKAKIDLSPEAGGSKQGESIDTGDKATDRYLQAVQTVEATHGEAIQELKERVGSLEKSVESLWERQNSDPASEMNGGDGGLNDLVSKIQGIQGDMERLGQTAERLVEDRENRETHINALLEQIELLKTIKADKEDLEDALADKADAQVLNRKVSHDQFDAACDDLARGLEDAISKMGKQEYIWQQALDEVQREIESKVDKIEMTPLKDFVSNRLKTLQEKLKSMADLRRESEAAGTKKMLRDVQCLSCDKNVVMRMEETANFASAPLPCSTSMKPYLTYELDQVRKQQKRLPHGRNLIQFEAAMQEESRKIKSARDEPVTKTPREHLCNRYCGGRHTVTTPQQRVMRVGHFLQQWGPQVVQLTEGLVKGTDGQLYRGRSTVKPDVCGPTCHSQREEPQPAEAQQPQASARRDSQTKRNSSGAQRLSSRKISAPLPAVEVTVSEDATEQTPSVLPAHEGEDEMPMDPTAHTDEIRYSEDLEHAGNSFNA